MIQKPNEQRKYSHLYFEEYARLSLSIIHPKWSDQFFIADKPDLQSVDGTIGIEVTSAERECIRQNSSYATQFFGKKVIKEEKDAFRGEFLINSEGAVCGYSPTKGLITPLKYADIEDVINKKAQKAKGYKCCGSLGLYIFSPVYFINEDLLKLSKIQNDCFEFLIVNGGVQIHVLKNEKVETFDVSDEELKSLKKRALDKAEKEHTK